MSDPTMPLKHIHCNSGSTEVQCFICPSQYLRRPHANGQGESISLKHRILLSSHFPFNQEYRRYGDDGSLPESSDLRIHQTLGWLQEPRPMSIAEIARKLSLSPSHLRHLFKRERLEKQNLQ